MKRDFCARASMVVSRAASLFYTGTASSSFSLKTLQDELWRKGVFARLGRTRAFDARPRRTRSRSSRSRALPCGIVVEQRKRRKVVVLFLYPNARSLIAPLSYYFLQLTCSFFLSFLVANVGGLLFALRGRRRFPLGWQVLRLE